MTTTRYYRWDDPGAPTLTGEVGSLHALLKTCLVGSAGVAYGTGPNEKAAAGWTVAYEDIGNFKLALRNNSQAEGGTGMCIRIHDNGTGTGGAREAFIRAYSDMSDIDTGDDATPTTAQQTTGLVVRKSGTLDSTARRWVLVCDELTCYLWINFNSTGNNNDGLYWWGDFESFVAGDTFRFGIGGRTEQNVNGGSVSWLYTSFTALLASVSGPGFYVARAANQIGTAVAATVLYNAPASNSMPGSSYSIVPSGQAAYAPLLLATVGSLRGRMRGLYAPMHSDLTTAPGTEISMVDGFDPTATFVLLRQAGATDYAAWEGHVIALVGEAW